MTNERLNNDLNIGAEQADEVAGGVSVANELMMISAPVSQLGASGKLPTVTVPTLPKH